jgi:hypothetical protein
MISLITMFKEGLSPFIFETGKKKENVRSIHMQIRLAESFMTFHPNIIWREKVYGPGVFNTLALPLSIP